MCYAIIQKKNRTFAQWTFFTYLLIKCIHMIKMYILCISYTNVNEFMKKISHIQTPTTVDWMRTRARIWSSAKSSPRSFGRWISSLTDANTIILLFYIYVLLLFLLCATNSLAKRKIVPRAPLSRARKFATVWLLQFATINKQFSCDNQKVSAIRIVYFVGVRIAEIINSTNRREKTHIFVKG